MVWLVKMCSCESGRLADGLHGHSFLTHAAAEVVELGAANLTAGHNLNLGNLGGVDGEGAFHAFAVGNLTNGESLVDAGATLPVMLVMV